MLEGEGRAGENELKEGGEDRIALPTTAGGSSRIRSSQERRATRALINIYEQRNRVFSRHAVE